MVASARASVTDVEVESYLRQHEGKELLRFVVIGSVDDGKSTLIGRLLHDSDGLYEDQLAAVRRASAAGATRGGGSTAELDLSLVTDGLRAEREQGITIDVAYRYFSTARRKFIIADTPGHVQYTRNMATGASTADVAVILVDARLGVLAQTRRHAYLASLLGIRRLIACVNKMDLVDWDRGVFTGIADEVRAFAGKLGLAEAHALPISALRGDHIVRRGDGAPWYEGPTLLALLETIAIGDRDPRPLRFPVQYVIRPSLDYRGFAGQIVSGAIRRGDEVVALPSGRRSRVASIDTFDGPLAEAFAPASVTVRLADEIDVGRGDMLVHAAAPPQVTTRFDATLVWLSERPLDLARSYLLKHTSRMVRAEVAAIAAVIDPETLTPRPAAQLALNDIGEVTIRAHQPLFVDAYADNRATGAFILIDSLSNDSVAAGMIHAAGRAGASAPSAGPDVGRSQVSPAERHARLGQRGSVIAVGGASADAAQRRAFLVERVLFDAGLIAAVVPVGAAAAIAAAGVLAVVVAPSDEDGAAPAIRINGLVVTTSGDDELAARAVVTALESTLAHSEDLT